MIHMIVQVTCSQGSTQRFSYRVQVRWLSLLMHCLLLAGWTVDETGAVIYTFEHVDYEELVNNHGTDTYQIQLRVRDANTARGTDFCDLSICVRLTDVNDNPPVWTQASYNISACISEVSLW